MKSHPCEQLEEYFDDCLSRNARLEFEEHLEDCPECQAKLTELEDLQESVLSVWSDVHLPATLNVSVVRERKNAKANTKRKKKRAITWTATAGIATAIAITFLLTNRTVMEEKDKHASTEELANLSSPVTFYEYGDEATLLSPIVSTSEFTIVKAFPVSIKTK